jgi:anti-anti-sigma factor
VGDVLIVAFSGEIGITASPAFAQKLKGFVAAGETRLILDLGDVTFIGSAGLGAISDVAKQIRQKKGELCLARVHYLNREVMNFFGLMPIVKICDHVADALKHLGRLPRP